METAGLIINGLGKPSSFDSNMEMQALREELDRVNAEFMRANEERAKAAEYGLVLLEEKQQLQYKTEELTSLYETTKQELDTSIHTLRQVQRDYEKRIRDIERQREQLLDEMDGREKELLVRVEGLEEERRGLERQLKKTSSQHDYLVDANAILSSENERLKKDISVQKEEIRSLKKEELNMQTELDDLRNEVERTRPKLEKITQYEEELHNLTEQNNSLHSDLTSLQEQYESILHERDDLEQQTKDVFQALNEEREAKTILETRLQEDMLRSPDRVPWLTESITHLASDIDPLQSLSAPTSPLPNGDNIHSTPFSTRPRLPSLLSELQHSFLPSATSELQLSSSGQNRSGELQIKLKETEAKNHVLESEKAQLEEKLRELEVMCSELEKWRVKYQQDIEGKEVDLTSLKDELTAKKEIIGQLKSKLSSLNGEKATLEIELEGSKEEMSRLRDTSKLEGEKLQKEIAEEQVRSVELRGRVTELEEKLSQNVNNVEKLEIVLVNSTGEMISMKEEILNLHKAVTSLHAENKFSTPPLSSSEVNTEKSSSLLPSNEDTSDVFYLSVQEGKKKLKINQESQTVTEVTQLRDLLRQVRVPLEAFTRRMLEHSLKTSSHLMAGNITGKSDDNSLKKIAELEGTINKLRARLANKTEEVTQLRTIMKARQTTVDVTVSSLKSKLDSQNRAHETEINQLKHKIKTLRKERDDQTSLCALTSRRCQEYLGEISKLKRKIDEVRGECDQLRSENKLVNVYLERSIKQKLEISQQLERYREEEERTRMIPLTLSASRV